jgi:hypothetical protein
MIASVGNYDESSLVIAQVERGVPTAFSSSVNYIKLRSVLGTARSTPKLKVEGRRSKGGVRSVNGEQWGVAD